MEVNHAPPTHYTLKEFAESPELFSSFRNKDPIPCVCGRCGAEHFKSKRVVRIALAKEGQDHVYCTRRCSSLRQTDGTWDERDGVVGRVCRYCDTWTPQEHLWNRKGWKCNTCAAKHPRFKFRSYKARAKSARIDFALTYEEFMVWWQKPCAYCGDPIETVGLDRVDSSQGYVLGNLSPCCRHCNWMKGSGTLQDFIARCQRVTGGTYKRPPLAPDRRAYKDRTYNLKYKAKMKGWAWALSDADLIPMWDQPCTYCGGDIKGLRLDRVDASQGYVPGNVVQCCHPCNRGKSNGHRDEFIARCIRVASRWPSPVPDTPSS